MKLLYLLCVLLLFNLAFLMIGNSPAKDWWPFDDNRYGLTNEFYFHEVQDKVTAIILCFVIAYEARHYKEELFVFACLQALDGIDFALTNNTPWFHVGVIPISMNVVSMSTFGIVTLSAWIRTRNLNYG